MYEIHSIQLYIYVPFCSTYDIKKLNGVAIRSSVKYRKTRLNNISTYLSNKKFSDL